MGLDPRDPQLQPPRPAGGISIGATVAFIAGVVVIVIVTVSVLAFLLFQRLNQGLGSAPVVAVNTVPCDQLEHTQVHYHAALRIFDAGEEVAIPTGVGRTGACYYWLHMHTGEPGIIHVEAPNDRTFTLAEFFQVWSAWSGEKQLLDATHVSDIALGSGQRLAVYVDTGNGPHQYTHDPRQIVLEGHEVITLEVTPPAVSPPPFDWPPGF